MNGEETRPEGRARRRREERRLFWMVVTVLVVGGGAVIAFTYGLEAVALGLVCLLTGAGILSLLWAVLLLMERISR